MGPGSGRRLSVRVLGPGLPGGGVRPGAHWGGIGEAAGQREVLFAGRLCPAAVRRSEGAVRLPAQAGGPQVEGLRPEDGPAEATPRRAE